MLKVFDSRDPAYRSPYGAVTQGTIVDITICPPYAWDVADITLMVWFDLRQQMVELPMRKKPIGVQQDTYKGEIDTTDALGPLWYHFRITHFNGSVSFYGNNERCRGGVGRQYEGTPPGYQLTVYLPEYNVPDWYGSGVTYQIFPDRFHRTSIPGTAGMVGNRIVHENWYDQPDFAPDEKGEVRNRDFFGGNILGVMEKLPYLQTIGVTTIYFNPVFEAAANHRYDTSDYMKIDPMFGTEAEFTDLCRVALQTYGIRVILDGVFNHTGFNSRYFNGNGFYDEAGAYQSTSSKYYNWFNFKHWPHDYESWWGIYTLPQVNESHPDYIDFIARGKDSVIRHWLKAGASGWRLDVADELPDEFIEEIRKALREECPDGILIGEVWEDASNKVAYEKRRQYLLGRGLDSVMNYPFRSAVIGYLRGEDAREFVENMENLREHYPKAAYYSLMNLIGTHDSPRILTVLGCDEEDYHLSKAERAQKRMSPEQRAMAIDRLKLAAAIQFSFPGSPLVYYGDEVGLEGFEDPFNRQGYPWGQENTELLDWYCRLGNARRNSEALRFGEIRWLYAHEGLLVYERSSAHETVVVAVNRSTIGLFCDLPWPSKLATNLMTGKATRTRKGILRLEVEPMTAVFLQD